MPSVTQSRSHSWGLYVAPVRHWPLRADAPHTSTEVDSDRRVGITTTTTAEDARAYVSAILHGDPVA